eukprot:CAMPEP_0182463268 /NCGR_PEP_ID=MMETSP1319-20130603/7246_1 /TAXON_ID=172717 /ORGANISM="Bolidomonas pacifica, Strain RCC208" /LENGTH=255 /DNA_ID=CAMNT_0024662789 /DNA_START=122 /DNA_END=886 /DNA_ORIENTATION=-
MTHIPWPLSSPPSAPSPPPSIVAVRDTVCSPGEVLLPTLAAHWLSQAAPSGRLVWVGCDASVASDVEAALSKQGASVRFAEGHHIYEDISGELCKAMLSSSTTASPTTTPSSYGDILLASYQRIRALVTTPSPTPTLVVVPSASHLVSSFPPSAALSYVSYLSALTYSSHTSLIYLVHADESLSHNNHLTQPLLTVSNVTAGSVDCKHFTYGGLVGSPRDVQTSPYDVAESETPHAPLPETRGSFYPLAVAGSRV